MDNPIRRESFAAALIPRQETFEIMKSVRRISVARRLASAAVTLASLAVCASPLAQAQDNTPRHAPPPHVLWQLSIISDGKTVDEMSADTAVGQSATITHRRNASHPVGCNGAQTLPVELSRTVSVSPLGVDPNGVIGFAISADEMVEAPEEGTVRSDGCALPPQPRAISARHPELDVHAGESADWVLLKKDPALTYRLTATVKAPASDD